MEGMKARRVVVTGMGVVSPNATNLSQFEHALKEGKSGITFNQELQDLGFGCQVSGTPPLTAEDKEEIKRKFRLIKVRTHGLIYGVQAGVEAWKHAGLEFSAREDPPRHDSGCIFGSGALGVDAFDFGAPLVRAGQIRKIGSRLVLEAMNSSAASFLAGIIGLGNQVTANSSACSTGTEAIIMAYDRIISGKAECMLAGSCESDGPIIWSVFDTIRALARDYNDRPQEASRAMSPESRGFVPGAGAGALVLEEYTRAKERGATIYAEIVGGQVNCGAQRQGGTITKPNKIAMIKCIRDSIRQANIHPKEIDLISGHLTSAISDPIEIAAWSEGLGLRGLEFPWINSIKSMTGHCIGAAGAIESVASILQLNGGFMHKNLNCQNIHPDIESIIDQHRIVRETKYQKLNYIVKANFGFGDINSCLVFKSAN